MFIPTIRQVEEFFFQKLELFFRFFCPQKSTEFKRYFFCRLDDWNEKITKLTILCTGNDLLQSLARLSINKRLKPS